MKKIFANCFRTMPLGARLLVLAYALGLVAWLGLYFHAFNVYQWLALSPALVWKGQVWRLVTYAFLPGSVVDWAVSLFWLMTLASIMGRNWSGRGFWGFCLLATVAGALPVVLIVPQMTSGVSGCAAMIFGLLVAWDRLYQRERLILVGIGEFSVRQAAILVAIINVLILFFCVGWFLTLSMLCGGVAGALYFLVSNKRLMRARSQTVGSDRIARLEL